MPLLRFPRRSGILSKTVSNEKAKGYSQKDRRRPVSPVRFLVKHGHIAAGGSSLRLMGLRHTRGGWTG